MGQFWVKTIALSGSVLGDRQQRSSSSAVGSHLLVLVTHTLFPVPSHLRHTRGNKT